LDCMFDDMLKLDALILSMATRLRISLPIKYRRSRSQAP
jgi:hypothetical protein